MKRILISGLMVFMVIGMNAQNLVQLEYFLDHDAGVGRNAVQNIPPAAQGNFPVLVNTTNMLPGLHQLYVRTRDNLGAWSQTSRYTIEIVPVESRLRLARGEYFFDHDPGFGAGFMVQAINRDSSITESFLASVSGLAPGYHKIYERWLDSAGRWSQTSRRNMEVVKSNDSIVVSGFEYSFISDLGVGSNNYLPFASPTTNGTFTATIPVSMIPIGYSRLYIRARDSVVGNYSFTQLRDSVFNPIILPLQIQSFTAVRENKSVALNWKTEHEVNTHYFNVQRRVDNGDFVTVAKVTAKGGVHQNYYRYNDPIAGILFGKLYYRLQEVDLDGAVIYSDIKLIEQASETFGFSMLPNPASKYLKLVPRNGTDLSNAAVVITDAGGRTLFSQKTRDVTGLIIPINFLKPGVYSVTLVTPGLIQTQKLVVK